MTALPAIAELYVISDLHLGGASPESRICTMDRELAGLVRYARTRANHASGQVALVLAGDIIDFLIPDPSASGTYLRPENNALAVLHGVFTQYAGFFAALRDFLSCAKARLIVILGNHDLELGWPRVWKAFADQLSGQDPARDTRLQALLDGDSGYVCQVGPAKVRCLHGNAVDPWNEVDYRQLHAHIESPQAEWQPNPGTRLVIDIMNRFKVEGRYAFVDLLKPEDILVPQILWAVETNPALRQALKSFIGLLPQLLPGKAAELSRRMVIALRSAVGLLDGAGAAGSAPLVTTSRPAPGVAALPPASELLAQARSDDQRGMQPTDLIQDEEGDLGFLGYAWQRLRNAPKEEALREALREGLRGDEAFIPGARDLTYSLLHDEDRRRRDGRADFLIAGHTHLARAIESDDGTFYFNTGTWMQLMRITPRQLARDADFLPIYQALTQDKKSLPELGRLNLTWSRPTVVRVVAEKQKNGVVAVGELCKVKLPATKSGSIADALPELIPLHEWPFVVRESLERKNG